MSPKKRVKMVLAYDGTDYLGWQATKMGQSIEESLQKVLEQILQHPISLEAASRTDAGVHATGQIAAFSTDKLDLDLLRLQSSLNRLLGGKIAVHKIEEVSESFHPTVEAQRKEYHYYLCLGKTQLPQHRLYSWHIPYSLDRQAMEKGAKILIGKYDFSAFGNVKKNESYENTTREVTRISFIDLDHSRLRIEIEGDGFLYKMVRNIVGTLVYVGRRKITLEEIPEMIQSKDRTLIGVTAPAWGLFLFSVYYGELSIQSL